MNYRAPESALNYGGALDVCAKFAKGDVEIGNRGTWKPTTLSIYVGFVAGLAKKGFA